MEKDAMTIQCGASMIKTLAKTKKHAYLAHGVVASSSKCHRISCF